MNKLITSEKQWNSFPFILEMKPAGLQISVNIPQRVSSFTQCPDSSLIFSTRRKRHKQIRAADMIRRDRNQRVPLKKKKKREESREVAVRRVLSPSYYSHCTLLPSRRGPQLWADLRTSVHCCSRWCCPPASGAAWEAAGGLRLTPCRVKWPAEGRETKAETGVRRLLCGNQVIQGRGPGRLLRLTLPLIRNNVI